MPLTIRVPYGGGIGAVEHHSESPEAYFTHTSGLRVVTCSTPQDAHTMIRQAIACDDPVLFFEPKRRYWTKGEVDDEADFPMDAARVVVTGTDVTIVTYGPLVATAIDAAAAAADEGVSIEVIDLRSLSPLDLETVEASGGLGAEIATAITDRCFYQLEAPPARVAGFDVPYPASRLEEHFLPDLDRMLDAVDRVMGRENALSGWSAS